MLIFKRIIFILIVICFAAGAFFVYSSSQKINFIKSASAQNIEKIVLKLRNNHGRWQDSVTKTWNIQNAMPGQMTPRKDFCRWIQLRNKGNIEAEQLIISLKNTSEELGNEESDTKKGLGGAEGMDEYVEIIKLQYGNWWWQKRNLKKELKDLNGNGFIDLDDFETQGFDNLEPPCIGNYPLPKPYSMKALLEWAKKPRKYLCRIKQMSICVRLHPFTPNDYQGDKVASDITFTLTD